MPVQSMTEALLHIYYPRLSLRLHAVEESIGNKDTKDNASARTMLTMIRQELNSMISKEQQLLFPLLLILEQEQRQSDCAPFKLIKKHVQSLLIHTQSLKQHLSSDPDSAQAREQLSRFEMHMTRLQRAKEKYLFNRFKRCNANCKIATNEPGK